MNELPDIAGITPAPDERRERSISGRTPSVSWSTIVLAVFLCCLMTCVVSVSVTVLGKENIVELLGVKQAPKKPDATELAVQELTSQVTLMAQALDDLEKKQTTLYDNVNANSFELDRVTLGISDLKKFSSGLELKIAQQQKEQKLAAAKKIVKTIPKPPVIIPVVLVSIRNQAGTSLVALRDGMDRSELLMPGDAWRGWTLLEANPTTKIARFTVNGQTQELRL